MGGGACITLENKNGDITGTVVGSYDDYAISSTVKKGESSLPDRKDGGSRTLTAVNNNGDIQVAFVGQPESAV